MTYKISKEAAGDIENIWLYTFENWSVKQADRYYNLIIDVIEYIASNPDSGKDYSHVRKGYRCSKVGSHLIFYRVNDEVEIVRVLHQRMDIENRLKE
ncbi:type II toxin-antitoxin system RelE/ParE family toxin (plasmid) [Pedobacter sp. BS3]|uniref:type II toxin-antitoxin system RelE/ParE family toxin n=1 Tax=Pedobacter sp. BS3 TaxID=2567937 RepID=UPI0011EE433B|nr:type II toxin-antitoxin system RelE/ParE family toxin [Pedobacter sp. BS3]TZF85973.1 type II toxin-antitoxin system RelE/ParE family toxin [Pedobacter sp. BS3]